MNVSLKFYCEVLGFNIHQSAGKEDNLDWVWLKWNNIDLMLNTAYETPYRPERREATRTAAHDDTILYFGCSDVDEAYKIFLSKGLTLNPPTIAPYGRSKYIFMTLTVTVYVFNGRTP